MKAGIIDDRSLPVENIARELLAREYDDIPTIAERILKGISRDGGVPRALRAIEQALTQQRGEILDRPARVGDRDFKAGARAAITAVNAALTGADPT